MASPPPTKDSRGGVLGFWSEIGRPGQIVLGVIVIAAVAFAVVSGGMKRPSTSGGTTTPASRCMAVPAALVQAIASGVEPGKTLLGSGWAVRSNDFDTVYFVAARISEINEVGVWATNDITGDGGLIFAADGFAKNFSDWGEGPGFSIADDGADEAKDCAGG